MSSAQEHINYSGTLSLSYTTDGNEEWVREVPAEFKPRIGQVFGSLPHAFEFYDVYAKACGFTPRKHNQDTFHDGVIQNKYVVCNKQGFKAKSNKLIMIDNDDDSEKKKKKGQQKIEGKKTKLTRTGCQASIKFSYVLGGYKVDQFNEVHNHPLCAIQNQEFEKVYRHLTLYHKQTIVNNCRLNIGATKTFRILKEQSNGYANIGATLTDLKNFKRDIKCFIGLQDAQLFINYLKNLSETQDGFYFAYQLDRQNCLCRVFWTDAQARNNYSIFGDTISFDPTYGTNKYFMVFTPFTGVDNHKKSVTFGAALLSHEDDLAFDWVFEKFLDCMGGKEPQCIITDQDAAIKNSVENKFKEATHRNCMWHIMLKLTDKVGPTICRDTDFVDRLANIVWDIDLEPLDFEEKWCRVIEDFELESNTWLTDIYSIRKKWIPAYSRDLKLGCILRTTQRSESENSFFKRFESVNGTLVEFWMRFQSAMDQQRHNQKSLDNASDNSLPQTVTPIGLEKHASKIYTHALFYEFQEEAKDSICSCCVGGFRLAESIEYVEVKDSMKQTTFQVTHNADTYETTCTCKLFEMKGILCKHIIWHLSGKRVQQIPEPYILERWTKKLYRRPRHHLDGSLVQDFDVTDVRKLGLSKLWSEFYATVSVLTTMPEIHTYELTDILQQYRKKIAPKEVVLSKEKEIEMLLDCSTSTEIEVRPPNPSRNKGSGKRLISKKNQSIEKAKKPKRLCNNCKQMANHDKRNCPNPYVDDSLVDENEKEVLEDV